MTETVLKLSIGGLPPMSARGCTQSLTPCPMGDMRRTINGQLIYTGQADRDKYKSVIRGKDNVPPAFEGLWRGQSLKVECLSTLSQRFIGNGKATEMTLKREPVKDSVVAFTYDLEEIPLEVKGKKIKFETAPSEKQDVFVTYRPHLEMTVTDFTTETDEWNLTCGWSLSLEEV